MAEASIRLRILKGVHNTLPGDLDRASGRGIDPLEDTESFKGVEQARTLLEWQRHRSA